ncbi:MAG: AAA family ATPase [Paludibacter sp.]|nr:AAA family ATPase [Paludibacter sp.]
MKKITVFYGPKKGYEKLIPNDNTSLSEFITNDDAKRKEIIIKQQNQGQEYEVEKIKTHIDNLVAYSESYAGITEGAVQSFISILSGYDIDNLFLQNPPIQIRQQFEQTFPKIVEVKKYNYKTLTKSAFLKINNSFSEYIVGQEKAKERILVSLYPLLNKSNRKPMVLMFYGPSGVGKTETAKFISKTLGEKLFRKQFSMFHSGEFSDYLFGGNHSQPCFAKDLLERESNVILLDEFDKPAPVFHSAFYQLFDEGVFEDKNYHVELFNSIIICTSNYQNEEEIRKHLGDPIFYRFDRFIKFDTLSLESIKRIIDICASNKMKTIDLKERKIVNIKRIKDIMYSNASRFTNVRQVDKIVQEFIDMELVNSFINSSKK